MVVEDEESSYCCSVAQFSTKLIAKYNLPNF